MCAKYVPPGKRNQMAMSSQSSPSSHTSFRSGRSFQNLEMEMKNKYRNQQNTTRSSFKSSDSKPIISYREDEIIKKHYSDCFTWIENKYPPKENEKNDQEAFRVAFRTNDLRLVNRMLHDGYVWDNKISKNCCLRCNKSMVNWLIDNTELPFDQETFETLLLRGSFECSKKAFRTRPRLRWTEEAVRCICASFYKEGHNYIQDMLNDFSDLKKYTIESEEIQDCLPGLIMRFKPMSIFKFLTKNKIITEFELTPMTIEGAAMGANLEALKWLHIQLQSNKQKRSKFSEYFSPMTLVFVAQNKPDKAIPCLEFLDSIGVKGDNDTLGLACCSISKDKVYFESLDKLLSLGCPPDSVLWLIAIKNNNIPLLEWIQKKGISYSEAMDSIIRDFANSKTIDWLQTRDLVA